MNRVAAEMTAQLIVVVGIIIAVVSITSALGVYR